jgi:hypothetical protein
MIDPATIGNGEEQHELLEPLFNLISIQYAYRHTDGELFKCIARTESDEADALEAAHQRRDLWLKRKAS